MLIMLLVQRVCRPALLLNHPRTRSGVVYNFSRVCLYVCTYDNYRKRWRRKFIFARPV